MRNLFDIFPDLPSLPARPARDRLVELRRRVLDVRQRAKRNAMYHKQSAAGAVARRGQRPT